jgi:hypothetical protein
MVLDLSKLFIQSLLLRQASIKNAPFGAFFISTRQLTHLHVFAGHASSWVVVYEARLDSKAQKLPTLCGLPDRPGRGVLLSWDGWSVCVMVTRA